MRALASHSPERHGPDAARRRRSSPRRRRRAWCDSVHRYLQEIGAYPVLSREAEARLAVRIRAGDQEALDELVRANLRFVVSVAKRYQHQGVPLEDLINEGNLGLIRAAHRFDETKGSKFISYAVWWIRQAILQTLFEQSRIVRLPMNRAGTLHRIGRRSNALLQELGREPTQREIAERLELTEEEVAVTIAAGRAHLSLHAPTSTGEHDQLLDYLPDEARPAPDEEVVREAMQETVARALGRLKERERRILTLYFGLAGEEEMTLEQIGARLGITRERVRQIKERALARLRHVEGERELASLLG